MLTQTLNFKVIKSEKYFISFKYIHHLDINFDHFRIRSYLNEYKIIKFDSFLIFDLPVQYLPSGVTIKPVSHSHLKI
jgi:hypothetical protein